MAHGYIWAEVRSEPSTMRQEAVLKPKLMFLAFAWVMKSDPVPPCNAPQGGAWVPHLVCSTFGLRTIGLSLHMVCESCDLRKGNLARKVWIIP